MQCYRKKLLQYYATFCIISIFSSRPTPTHTTTTTVRPFHLSSGHLSCSFSISLTLSVLLVIRCACATMAQHRRVFLLLFFMVLLLMLLLLLGLSDFSVVVAPECLVVLHRFINYIALFFYGLLPLLLGEVWVVVVAVVVAFGEVQKV